MSEVYPPQDLTRSERIRFFLADRLYAFWEWLPDAILAWRRACIGMTIWKLHRWLIGHRL